MDFHEKLKRRAAEVNKAKAGQAAGLKANTISSYLAKGSVPRADIAYKIAKALDVPIDWLLNDNAEWPPPAENTVKSDAALLSDDELMVEVCRRYRLVAVRLHDELRRAAEVNWLDAAVRLLALTPGEKVPPDLDRDVRLPGSIAKLLKDLQRFDPSLESIGLHNRLPGRKLDPEELMTDRLISRRLDLWEQKAGFAQVQQFYGFWETPQRGPEAKTRMEEWRRIYLMELAAAEGRQRRGEPAGQPSGRTPPPPFDGVVGQRGKPDRARRKIQRDR